MGLAEGFFKCFGQQMEIDGDNQTAGGDPEAYRGGKTGEADGAGRQKQDPIGVDDEFNDPLLSIHTNAFAGLKISQFLDGQTNVSDGGDDT